MEDAIKEKQMSFGSSKIKKPILPPPTPPAPINVKPEVDLARRNVRERLLRAKGRAASQVTGGPLSPPNLLTQRLKDTLG